MPKSTPPRRKPNAETRAREYLTPAEIERLGTAAGLTGRNGFRDSLMILLAYRHGLRVSELVGLCWTQVHFAEGLLDVKRRKSGTPSTHPLTGGEIRCLRRLLRESGEFASPYLFNTERRGPLTESTFRKIVARAGLAAELGFPVHPHMLRHSTGYKLVNDGQDTRAIQHYLGHKNIQHTVRYTELAPDRFKDFWKD